MAAVRRHISFSRLSLAIGLSFGATAAVQAQSLQELYDAARGYDASYLGARAQAESVQYRLGQAKALTRPSVGLGISDTQSRNDPASGTSFSSNTLAAGLSAKMALYNRGNGLQIDQAQRGVEAAESDLAAAEQDLIVRVSQAYFDVLAARDTRATSRANKTAIAEQLASAKRNFEVGTATITDTREAQARYDLATAQELAADNDLRIKGVALDQIVGRVGVDPKALAVPVALPALPSTEVETWVAQAEAQHPGIRKARVGLEIAQLESDKAKALDAPTVDLTGTLGAQRSRNSLPAALAGATGVGTAKNASVGISLNYPLYTGGYNQNRQQETLALQERARNDLEFARRAVVQGTRQAFFGVQSLQSQVKAYEAAESSTKLALEATQLGYKVGVRVNLDVLNAQTQLFSTQRDLAKARYDVITTGLKLRQASGQLRAEDVAAVNLLLTK